MSAHIDLTADEQDQELEEDPELAWALQASLQDASRPSTNQTGAVPQQQQQQQRRQNVLSQQPRSGACYHAAQPGMPAAVRAAGRQPAQTCPASDDDHGDDITDNDNDDTLDLSFLHNSNRMPSASCQGTGIAPSAQLPCKPPLQDRCSGTGPQVGVSAPARGHVQHQGPVIESQQPFQAGSAGIALSQRPLNACSNGADVDDVVKQQIRQQYNLSDQDIMRPAAAKTPVQDVLPKEEWATAAQRAGDQAAQQAEQEGCTTREVKRRQKAAASATLSKLRAAGKEYEKQMKLQAKEADKQAKAQAKLEKKEAVAQLKASAKEYKAINKALSGGPVDPSKFMVLRLSVRMMEVPWISSLVSRLQEEKYEYKVDADMPLSSKHAFVRWTRRAPRAAAAALLQQQLQDDQGGPPSLEIFSGQQQVQQRQQDVDLVFPMLCVFLSPEELISTCTPPAAGTAVAAGPSRSQAQRMAPPFMPLQALMAAMHDAYPHATLMLACVGLNRQLTAMERAAGSVFNSQVVHDQFLDMQLMYPAVRFREDLVDGPQAAEWLVTTSRCLGNHHRKQQEGYLNSFNLSRVRADVLEGLPHGARTMAVALGHLLPPQRAALLASTYPNLPALLQVLNDTRKSVKEREAAVKLASSGAKAATLGAQSAKNVFDFFTQTNPSAGCKAGEA